MNKTMAILVVMLLALTGCKKTSPQAVAEEAIIVGVYDSRVIALAYWQQEIDGKERAQRHEDLGMKAIDLGVLMHQQVFSYHKPTQALEYIADKLPEAMKDAGVDVIVSKWNKEELAKYQITGSGWDDEFATNNPNIVDVTTRLAELFHPKEGFFKSATGFDRTKPEPLDTDWLHAEE